MSLNVERRLLDTGVFRAFEVNFACGKSTLQPRATRTLDAVEGRAAALSRPPHRDAGHTDAVGADAVNQQLSEARAEGAGCRRLRDLLGRLLCLATPLGRKPGDKRDRISGGWITATNLLISLTILVVTILSWVEFRQMEARPRPRVR